MGTPGAWWSISGYHWSRVSACQTRFRGLSYLCFDVVKRRGADNGEADEEHVRLGVRERAQSVVVLLAGRVPQPQAYGLAVDHDICRVVVEAGRVSSRVVQRGAGVHGGDVLAREGVGRVRDEETCLRG